jgi:hypothetical protein
LIKRKTVRPFTVRQIEYVFYALPQLVEHNVTAFVLSADQSLCPQRDIAALCKLAGSGSGRDRERAAI